MKSMFINQKVGTLQVMAKAMRPKKKTHIPSKTQKLEPKIQYKILHFSLTQNSRTA